MLGFQTCRPKKAPRLKSVIELGRIKAFSTEERKRAAAEVFWTITGDPAPGVPFLPSHGAYPPLAAVSGQTPAGLADNRTELINRGTSFFVLIPEQAVQETVDTDLYVRRRQRPTASRRYREGYR